MSIPPDAQKCLDELTYYIDSIVTPSKDFKIVEGMRMYMPGESIMSNTVIENHLFSLACYMRRDDKKYTGLKNIAHRNSDVTNKILNGVRDIKKKLKGETGEFKKLYKDIGGWLTRHMGKPLRYKNVSTKKCGGKAGLQEEIPTYLLNAITKEKPVHPVYGNLRY